MIYDKPSFAVAVARFQEFLGKCGYSERIAWLMPDDVLVSGERFVYVRFPVPTGNEASVRDLYDEGIARGHGVLMSTICELEGSTGCYVWYPKNEEEQPQGMWPRDGSPKMSAESTRMQGHTVRSRLLWMFLGLRLRREQELKYLLWGCPRHFFTIVKP
jgi:hypothetical protein